MVNNNLALLKKENIEESINQAWKVIAPFWPLESLVAVNPLQGFEDLPIEVAIKNSAFYFQQNNLPEYMHAANRENIKWLQAFFDEGQATISMPLREDGIYNAWRQLAIFDSRLHRNNKDKKRWLNSLPNSAIQFIVEYFQQNNFSVEDKQKFLSLLLTTLPGWSSYIKYCVDWKYKNYYQPHPITKTDYLALRLAIICLTTDKPHTLLEWNQTSSGYENYMEIIKANETRYHFPLLKALAQQNPIKSNKPNAQFVFCIDVRSEPFRSALEQQGNYETFGYAGFFGLPIALEDCLTKKRYASCPVLLTPQHTVREQVSSTKFLQKKYFQGYKILQLFKSIYKSLKYTFTTPFLLAEALGIISGAWMIIKNINPLLAKKIKAQSQKKIQPAVAIEPSLSGISLAEKCSYAENMLRSIGLTQNIAELIILCGHGSTTENNAYSSALDCGACGGRHGAANARAMAAILNDGEVRAYLIEKGIPISNNLCVIAAEHNTTTDQVEIYPSNLLDNKAQYLLNKIKKDLRAAGHITCQQRLEKLPFPTSKHDFIQQALLRSLDWAQVRPEWGLARNAAFIVAPRTLTKAISLEGRCFLHSYDYTADHEGLILAGILTAPMVVAQWINAQYLFSTLDNISYGAGSKVTHNITGKIGIMQGNASDLMTGLPLQSIFATDKTIYHEPVRLLVVIYSERELINKVIAAHPLLKKLFMNEWVLLACIEPNNHYYYLKNDFSCESNT